MPAQPWWWTNLKPIAIWNTTRVLDKYPRLRVTSAWRSPAQNKRAKGVKNSGHLTGRCVDLVGAVSLMQVAATYARKLGAHQVLIHDAGSGLHLHIDWGDA